MNFNRAMTIVTLGVTSFVPVFEEKMIRLPSIQPHGLVDGQFRCRGRRSHAEFLLKYAKQG